MATDRILVDGSPVGYMYRDGSGWVFTAGDETPEYLTDPGHVNLLSLNEIANYDRAILRYLQAPPGSAFIRHEDAFVEDPEGAPRDPDEPTPPALNPQFPVVNGYHELTVDWVLTVPEPMNFRIDQDAGSSRAVFWRPGLTAMLTLGQPQERRPCPPLAAGAWPRFAARLRPRRVVGERRALLDVPPRRRGGRREAAGALRIRGEQRRPPAAGRVLRQRRRSDIGAGTGAVGY
ncbi:DUF2185 domain-containing protein [Mycobacterium syngnathidarum]|uniref:DUF2185 domain-containing protein n=1 Tax=Mycobacterium syngnathidarum TaxID=1908205 RepID=UPI000A64004E|nr:DUF2185 domain-containing protein [Mycobacterium syngnathidarum]